MKPKKVIILYWHGLGDVIMLTPMLRYFSQHGHQICLMCRPEVGSSNLLGNCIYVDELVYVTNPWQSAIGFERQKQANITELERLSKDYVLSISCLHEHAFQNCKIATNWKECGIKSDNNRLEVFIPSDTEARAMDLIASRYPDGYIHRHTQIEFHTTHNWDCTNWIKKHLPDLPVVDTGLGGNYYCVDPDINFSFVLAREAQHRVLSSSVFVHACEAMGATIDVINYGRPDHKVWPKNQGLVKKIREAGRWIK
jgi:hypothetical protein